MKHEKIYDDLTYEITRWDPNISFQQHFKHLLLQHMADTHEINQVLKIQLYVEDCYKEHFTPLFRDYFQKRIAEVCDKLNTEEQELEREGEIVFVLHSDELSFHIVPPSEESLLDMAANKMYEGLCTFVPALPLLLGTKAQRQQPRGTHELWIPYKNLYRVAQEKQMQRKIQQRKEASKTATRF
ncbi:MAG: hypothetical protein ACTSUE_05040 [Promethearchaeota archaeon]